MQGDFKTHCVASYAGNSLKINKRMKPARF